MSGLDVVSVPQLPSDLVEVLEDLTHSIRIGSLLWSKELSHQQYLDIYAPLLELVMLPIPLLNCAEHLGVLLKVGRPHAEPTRVLRQVAVDYVSLEAVFTPGLLESIIDECFAIRTVSHTSSALMRGDCLARLRHVEYPKRARQRRIAFVERSQCCTQELVGVRERSDLKCDNLLGSEVGGEVLLFDDASIVEAVTDILRGNEVGADGPGSPDIIRCRNEGACPFNVWAIRRLVTLTMIRIDRSA